MKWYCGKRSWQLYFIDDVVGVDDVSAKLRINFLRNEIEISRVVGKVANHTNVFIDYKKSTFLSLKALVEQEMLCSYYFDF